MFDRIKKAFQREARNGEAAPSQFLHGPVSEWAQSRGMSFSSGALGHTVSMQGKVGGRPWRMELGRPTRDYIAGEELRARAELGVNDDVGALAQPVVQGINPGDKTVQIIGLQTEPGIDGVADEAVWKQAAPIDDFHQYNPREFVEPFERTTVRMFYTEDALFVSAHMEESDPGRITAQVLRQGQGLNADDVFALILDPYLDRRNGYRFDKIDFVPPGARGACRLVFA